MGNEQITWDCVEYKTIWEAEYAVKFPVFVPAVLGTEHIRRIAVIGKKLVEIRYSNDIVYRTAEGTEDISGDYNKYNEEKKFDAGKEKTYHVTAKGFYGKIFLAIWNDGGRSYSLHAPHGVSQKNIELLIESLTQVDSCGTMTNTAAPNPMVEYTYIFEAEYAVDFGVAVPTVLGTDKIEHIYVISGKVVELDYKNDIVYRTALGEEDISGVYTTYPYTEIFEEGAFHVTAKGNVDLYYVAVWTGCGMSWSLYCPHGIHKKSLITLIRSMCQVNSCDAAVDESQSVNPALGGYTRYHAVTEEEIALFNEAMNLQGVHYEPLLVATQVVSGMNYRFICNAEMVVLNPEPYLAQVTIFTPLPSAKSKKPVITDIKTLN